MTLYNLAVVIASVSVAIVFYFAIRRDTKESMKALREHNKKLSKVSVSNQEKAYV